MDNRMHTPLYSIQALIELINIYCNTLRRDVAVNAPAMQQHSSFDPIRTEIEALQRDFLNFCENDPSSQSFPSLYLTLLLYQLHRLSERLNQQCQIEPLAFCEESFFSSIQTQQFKVRTISETIYARFNQEFAIAKKPLILKQLDDYKQLLEAQLEPNAIENVGYNYALSGAIQNVIEGLNAFSKQTAYTQYISLKTNELKNTYNFLKLYYSKMHITLQEQVKEKWIELDSTLNLFCSSRVSQQRMQACSILAQTLKEEIAVSKLEDATLESKSAWFSYPSIAALINNSLINRMMRR